MKTEEDHATFVLLHGAWHTGRVWDSVADALTARGHSVIAPDLPIDSVEACGEQHAGVIVDACAGVEGEIVAVAHTSAGLILPLLAERMELARMVYVNGLLPLIGASFSDQLSSTGYKQTEDSGRQYDREARSFWADREAFRERLAADCSDAEVDRLWSQLRGQARCPLREITPLKSWPATPSSAIVYTDDRDLPVDWMKRCAEERLGVEPIELAGSQLGFVAQPERFAELVADLPR